MVDRSKKYTRVKNKLKKFILRKSKAVWLCIIYLLLYLRPTLEVSGPDERAFEDVANLAKVVRRASIVHLSVLRWKICGRDRSRFFGN